MKTLSLLISILSLIVTTSFSQSYFFKVFGRGTRSNYISQNNDGKFIVTLDSSGSYGCIVDENGNVILKKEIPYGARTIEQLSNGNYIIASTVPGNFGFNIATLVTTNSTLDSITAKNFPSSQNGSRGTLAIPTKDNNIIFCYWDDGPLHANTGFVKKLDLSGNTIWTNYSGTSEMPTSGIIQDNDSNFVWVISDWTNVQFFTFNKLTNQGNLGYSSTISDTSFCFCFDDNISICDFPNGGYIAGTVYDNAPMMIRFNDLLDTLWTKQMNFFTTPVSIVQDDNAGVMVLTNPLTPALMNLDTNGNVLSYNVINNLTNASGSKLIKSDDGAYVTVGTLYDSSLVPYAFIAKTNQFGLITNTENISFENSLKVYPNPAHDRIVIDVGNNNSNQFHYCLRIDNILGTNVFSNNISGQFQTIDLTSLSGKGIYFVYIIDDNKHIIDLGKIVFQ